MHGSILDFHSWSTPRLPLLSTSDRLREAHEAPRARTTTAQGVGCGRISRDAAAALKYSAHCRLYGVAESGWGGPHCMCRCWILIMGRAAVTNATPIVPSRRVPAGRIHTMEVNCYPDQGVNPLNPTPTCSATSLERQLSVSHVCCHTCIVTREVANMYRCHTSGATSNHKLGGVGYWRPNHVYLARAAPWNGTCALAAH